MRIAVQSILQAASPDTNLDFNEEVALVGNEEILKGPVRGAVKIHRASNQILQVQGHLAAQVQLSCDRCAESFLLDADFPLDETLEIVDRPLPEEEVGEQVRRFGELDLSDLVRQALVISLPTRRLCGCAPRAREAGELPIDPRWSKLSKLVDKLPGVQDA